MSCREWNHLDSKTEKQIVQELYAALRKQGMAKYKAMRAIKKYISVLRARKASGLYN